ncbi:hypothetical protein D9V29_09580 [Mycetocola manganoxydans]|uniref:Uncharacterized protein n=1 Tax=Mycetocola manganoxydans TaxID=699879 RepID=A0A3L6ZSE7_9MICO|nr:hypothetical protein [Mycetocola manganoxydans]RLP70739.1 hypothetical protein D9V29_09580 [Mycetocola manganoxydans]GHD48594.1 hypothetical protein GCM10008097_20740 [Mycetocola manganoxydans]
MADPTRLEFTLTKPPVGWFPKPTVVFGGRGQPAQWGTGTWQVPSGESTVVSVFLFNRLWKFGYAEITLEPGSPVALRYRAPWLPVGPGKLDTVPR